ncbi:protein DOG1-like 4 [Diospyros lotus]|uniref:protein DOG1-like 4 n=1 Tax=Diospyros lotus TaxID=55363 RepID=UPI0022557F72|nr:protein DOG1-like 4 [Diospyros lotus]
MMKTQVEERFSDFYENWFCQLEADLQILQAASTESECEALVAKLTAHHKAYYTAKWAAAHEDVLAFFMPVWLSPLENAHLWITGWKPSMAFRMVAALRQTKLADMTEAQRKKVEELRVRIRVEEEKVEREMERQQVAMADRRMVELARMSSRVSGDETATARLDGMVEAAVKNLLAGLEKVMKMADCVRLRTLKGLLEAFSPKQSVDLLAATSTLQIQLRSWGKNHESESGEVVQFVPPAGP